MTSHPQVLLIPLLMLIDYSLTIVGARLAEGGYRRHFKFPDYELNPVFQKHIALKKWSPRHAIAVVVAALVCVAYYQFWQEGDPFLDPYIEASLGALFAVFTTIIGVHLGNIWLFYFLLKHPEQISGEVLLSQRYVLHGTRARTLMTLLPLAISACLVPSPFLDGAVGGVLALMIVQSIWMWRDGRKTRRDAQHNRTLTADVHK